MKRRTFLAAAGVALSSGCLESRARTDGGTPSQREINDISVSVPESSLLSIETTITNDTITPEQTAQFEITVIWNGEETHSLGFGNEIPFSEPKYSTSPEGLLLLTSDSGIERRNQDVWLPKTGDDGRLPTKQNMVVGELSPGESVKESWAVWGDPRHVSYIESGTYEFENSIGVGSANSDSSDEISWTLMVSIEPTK